MDRAVTRPALLLVGNGSNENRGCEAINRGTLAIFRACTNDIHVATGIVASPDVVSRQKALDDDDDPETFGIDIGWPTGLAARLKRRLTGRDPPVRIAGLATRLANAELALEAGGDNYSLDYGVPRAHMAIDREIFASKVPLAIWGASIGPFDRVPEFETEILAHFRRMRRIFVRESISRDYLLQKGLENVTLMADPAYLLAPRAPAEPQWDVAAAAGAIGLNFSPFQAKKFNGRHLDYWQFGPQQFDPLVAQCIEIVETLVRAHDRPFLLVPHVMTGFSWNNDWLLLQRIHKGLSPAVRERVQCLPQNLDAAELKWAISRCSVFAGSRTHSTIAAMSSGVPALTFGYSRKALGLARDLYGDDDFCIPLENFDTATVAARMGRMIADEPALAKYIAEKRDRSIALALAAGREAVSLCAAAME